RLAELERDACGGVEVEQVRVGQLLPLVSLPFHAPRRAVAARPYGFLVRVLTVSELADIAVMAECTARERRSVTRDPGHRLRDEGVELSGVGERFLHQLELELEATATPSAKCVVCHTETC